MKETPEIELVVLRTTRFAHVLELHHPTRKIYTHPLVPAPNSNFENKNGEKTTESISRKPKTKRNTENYRKRKRLGSVNRNLLEMMEGESFLA